MISVGCAVLGIQLSSLLRLTSPPLWRMHLADLPGSEWADGPLNCEGSGFVGPLFTPLPSACSVRRERRKVPEEHPVREGVAGEGEGGTDGP